MTNFLDAGNYPNPGPGRRLHTSIIGEKHGAEIRQLTDGPISQGWEVYCPDCCYRRKYIKQDKAFAVGRRHAERKS